MNAYEAAARARKVAAIMATVPHGKDAAEVAVIASWLESFRADDIARFAAAAGVKVPSETTWAEVVKTVRARKTADQLFARVARSA